MRRMKSLFKSLNVPKYRSIIVFIAITAVLFSFFYIRSQQSFERFKSNGVPVDSMQLESGCQIDQELSVDSDNISYVSLLLGTYLRNNEGSLTVTLYDNDVVVNQWVCDTMAILDNEYARFDLDQPYKIQSGHRYSVSIEDSYEGDNGLGLFKTVGNDGSEQFCYGYGYKNTEKYLPVMITAVLILAVTITLILLSVDERWIMTFMVIAIGIAYLYLCPLGMVPDEREHFFRAYEVSHGNVVSEHMGEYGIGGNNFPSTLNTWDDENAVLDWTDLREYKFGNTSLYSPVSYLPHAAAMSIAEHFITRNPAKVFYAGRLGGFITCMVLTVAALWIIPFGRKVFFMIMMNPMTMQEVISVSPDGFTIALSLFLFAYVLYLSYRTRKINIIDSVLLGVVCIALSQCKIVYVVLLFLLLIIPQESFTSKRISILYKIGILAGAIVLNLLWLTVSSGYLVEFQPGVNSSEQVRFVLGNLFEYYAIAVRTTIEKGAFFVHSMLGSDLGAFNVGVPYIVWISSLIIFVYQIVSNRDMVQEPHARDKYVMMLVFLMGTALIYTSLYVQWTPLQNEIINGVQGRYFIPLIALPAFCAMYYLREREVRHGNKSFYQIRSTYFYVFLLLFNGISVVEIIRAFLL